MEFDAIKKHQNRWRKVPFLKLWFKPINWPWQYKRFSAHWDTDSKVKIGDKWGWSSKTGGMGRMGGGWRWKLGIDMGGTCLITYLIWGYIRWSWDEKDKS